MDIRRLTKKSNYGDSQPLLYYERYDCCENRL